MVYNKKNDVFIYLSVIHQINTIKVVKKAIVHGLFVFLTTFGPLFLK
jgi:hypothetical protein